MSETNLFRSLDSLAGLGLSTEKLVQRTGIRATLAFQGSDQPSCRVIPKLTELGYDLVGPTTIGETLKELLLKEKPDVLTLRIDTPGDESALAWIGRAWQEFGVPTAVVTMDVEPLIYAEAVQAGAFAVVREDAALAAVEAAVTITAHRGAALRAARERITQLETNLAHRRLIEQAKWTLVQRDGMTEPDAHLALQSVARNSRVPLTDVAQRIIDGGQL